MPKTCQTNTPTPGRASGWSVLSLYAAAAAGIVASLFGAFITFRSPWTPLFSTTSWRVWLAALRGMSALAAVGIYTISELMHRRQAVRLDEAPPLSESPRPDQLLAG